MVWSAVSGLVGVLLGLFLGHRLSLGRDRRKEFNEATYAVRRKLGSHIPNLGRNSVVGRVTAVEISEIVGALGERRSVEITKCFNRYAATIEKCVTTDAYGVQLPLSPGCKEELVSDAKVLYKVVQPK